MIVTAIAPIEPSIKHLNTLNKGERLVYKIKDQHSVAFTMTASEAVAAWGTAEITLKVSNNGYSFFAPPFAFTYAWTAAGAKCVMVAGFLYAALEVTVVNAAALTVQVDMTGINEMIE